MYLPCVAYNDNDFRQILSIFLLLSFFLKSSLDSNVNVLIIPGAGLWGESLGNSL